MANAAEYDCYDFVSVCVHNCKMRVMHEREMASVAYTRGTEGVGEGSDERIVVERECLLCQWACKGIKVTSSQQKWWMESREGGGAERGGKKNA